MRVSEEGEIVSANVGNWFTIDLRTGNERAVCLLAAASESVGRGYFFLGSRFVDLATEGRLRPEDAFFIARFSTLGIENGRWEDGGPFPNFNRADWADVAFVSRDPLRPRCTLIFYDELNPGVEIGRDPVECAEVEKFPLDGLLGYKLVEARLSRA